MPPVAEHGHAISESEDLIHPVAHVHDGDTFVTNGSDTSEEGLRLATRKRRRGLIEDQKSAIACQSPCNHHHLPLSKAPAFERHIWIEGFAKFQEARTRPVAHLCAINEQATELCRLAHELVVLHRGHR